MRIIKNVLTITGVAIILSGCASINLLEEEPFVMPDREELITPVKERLIQEAAGIIHMPGYSPLVIEKPIVIPREIRNQRIEIEFNNNTTFRDLPAILETLDITAIIKNEGLSDDAQLTGSQFMSRRNTGNAQEEEEPQTPQTPQNQEIMGFNEMGDPIMNTPPTTAAEATEAFDRYREFQQQAYYSSFFTRIENIQIGLPRYRGTVGEMLDLLANLHNVSFNWQYGNYLVIERLSDYVITVPQEEELIAEIVTEIEKLGAEDITSSLRAGTITYKSNKNNHNRVTRYINRLTYNSPDVGIQLAIVSVELNENMQSGFDWSSLQASIGTSTNENFGINVNTSGAESAGITLTGPGAEVNAAISILDRYGSTRTEQSVLLKTIGGKPVSFDTVQEVRYISGVNEQAVTTANNEGTGNVARNFETEMEEVGLTLMIAPFYDADSQLFTMDVEFESSSVLGFVELSDNIRQPNLQRQTFQNSVKLKPGEAIILGGLTYDSVSDSRQGVNFFEDRLDFAHRRQERTRRAMFIILRPTVKIYGNFEQEQIIQE